MPRLRREIVRQHRDVIEFKNGAALEIATNDARLIRGRSAIAVLGSECCHWKTDEASAIERRRGGRRRHAEHGHVTRRRPAHAGLLRVPQTRLHVSQVQELFGNDDAEDLCWFAPSAVMNPVLPMSAIDKAMEEDAAKARAEFLGIWREDLSDFIPIDVIDADTDWGVTERPPVAGIKYVAWVDAAGGTGRDSFALAIAHRNKDKTLTLDLVRERKPRFIASAVVAEFAEILRRYEITQV